MTTFLVEHPHARRTDLQLRGERVEPLAFCPAIHWCGSNGSSATASNSLIRVTAWSWRRVSDQVVTPGLLEGRVTRGCAIRSSRASRASGDGSGVNHEREPPRKFAFQSKKDGWCGVHHSSGIVGTLRQWQRPEGGADH